MAVAVTIQRNWELCAAVESDVEVVAVVHPHANIIPPHHFGNIARFRIADSLIGRERQFDFVCVVRRWVITVEVDIHIA